MADNARIPSGRRLLDLLEQIVVLGLYVWLVFRLWPGELSASNWFPLLLLVSEGLVVLLLLIRRPTSQISMNLWDWSIAAGGTFLALLVAPGEQSLAPNAGAVLMLLGIMIHVGAKLSLWRNFGLVAARRGVTVGGLYLFLRHPMYAGYVISHIGFLLVVPSYWNLSVYLGVWTLLVLRIFAEERILSGDPQYRAFMSRVRYRLVPGVF